MVVGGMTTEAVIDTCAALVKAHREFTVPEREALGQALIDCKNASKHRNTLVHGLKSVISPDGTITTSKSQRRSYKPVVETWTMEQIRDVGVEIGQAVLALLLTVRSTVRAEFFDIDTKLLEEEAYAAIATGEADPRPDGGSQK
jgi:hypothetical protein